MSYLDSLLCLNLCVSHLSVVNDDRESAGAAAVRPADGVGELGIGVGEEELGSSDGKQETRLNNIRYHRP